ncbi:MAG: PDZ domain-containing protein [Verrucomicrobia bacterium]|nr:PDZ domain-containing protein [Verrucomicrobiota bacterium]
MKARLTSVAVLLVTLSGSLLAQTESGFSAIQRRITGIFAENSNGVFRVMAAHTTYDEKGDLQFGQRSGTGCFISREGLILANASVVMNSDRTWFKFRGIDYSSELIGVEPSTNLALLKANNLPEHFTFFIPEPNQALPEVGSMVLMISCPWDFEPSPLLTMVAGADASFANREFTTTHLRINTIVRGGEGGAPLIDLNGRFVGILVVSTPAEIAYGYVLPARAVLRIRDDLLFAGKFIHGWIGIEIGVRSTIRDGRQIYLTHILPDSPSANAGLRKDDVLVRMGDITIQSISDVKNAMFFARAGQFLDVQVFRGGVLQDFTVKVTERPEEQSKVPPAEVTNPAEEASPSLESIEAAEEKPS